MLERKMNSDLSTNLMNHIFLLNKRFFYDLHCTNKVGFFMSHQVHLSEVAFSQKFQFFKIKNAEFV